MATPARNPPSGAADVDLALNAAPDEVAIVDGPPTPVWRFSARARSGRGGAVTDSPGSYLGPTLELRRGDRVRVRLENGIDEETIVHWHGLYVSERDDGHPRFVIPRGERYDYDFEVNNRAGTYWYHPHPAHRTGPQVYHGMAGLLIVRDEEEEALGLPPREQELSLVLQDRLFGPENRLEYDFDRITGFLGDQILVNGRPPEPLGVREGSYRIRLLNASNTRIYKLGWSDDSPVTVIATDGGLLPAPERLPYLTLAPGQRAELWAEFGRSPAGTDVTLRSLPFSGTQPAGGMGMGRGGMGPGGMGPGGMGRGGMGPGGMGPRGGMGPGGGMGPPGMRGPEVQLAQGEAFDVQPFVIRGRGTRRPLPERLAAIEALPASERAPIPLVAQFRRMTWTLTGRTFEMLDVAPSERIPRGAVQDWELENPGHMMAMAHPIHLHGPHFEIVERRIDSRFQSGYRTLSAGFVRGGRRDTVLLMPGERIRLRARYADHPGLFLYHCHNLEHEDQGMMRNYLVEP